MFATITAPLPILTAGIPKVGIVVSKMVVKFLNIRGLLIELIYQVRVSYGFDNFNEGDCLAILTLAFPIKNLAQLGMEFLLKDSELLQALLEESNLQPKDLVHTRHLRNSNVLW